MLKIKGLFNTKEQYVEWAQQNHATTVPDELYDMQWMKLRYGWYDFLGVDISCFPNSMEEWKKVCKTYNICSIADYRSAQAKFPSLYPSDPSLIYPGFRNLESELGLDDNWDAFF